MESCASGLSDADASDRPTTPEVPRTSIVQERSSRDSVEGRARSRIMEANREARERAHELFSLPLTVLVDQRDRALEEIERLKQEAERRREEMEREQDAFIAFLMAEHEAQLAAFERERATVARKLERALSAPLPPLPIREVGGPGVPAEVQRRLDEAETRVLLLAEQLRDAGRELEEQRREMRKLEEEHDRAMQAAEDSRVGLFEQLQESRDEAFALEQQLGEARRNIDDARDDARDELYRVSEQLDAARRELDERREEVRRLRARLSEASGEAGFSRPPPAPGSEDLEAARDEAKGLRKQLIDAKRELSRLTRGREGAEAPRPRSEPAQPELRRARSDAASRASQASVRPVPRKITLLGIPGPLVMSAVDGNAAALKGPANAGGKPPGSGE